MREDENTPEQLERSHAQAVQSAGRSPATKKWHVALRWSPVLFVVAALAATTSFHPFFVYQTYLQGTCTIQSGTVQTQYTKSGTHYTPFFAYIVQPKNGQRVLTSGYEAPSSEQYATSEEAQQVVERYSVGGTYPCWYDPAVPTHAALVFHGYSLDQAITLYIVLILGFFVMLILFSIVFYPMVYLPVRLMRKGIHTQGQVAGHFMKSVYIRGKGMTDQPYSRIVFHLQSDPARSQSLEVSGSRPIDSELPVLYDPAAPEKAQIGGSGCLLTYGLVLSLFILALILVVEAALWFV